ncbi:hypothetical protein I4U23_000613 [Adineta vaga]|nr:hypothetical protein I4U23_000613 [Adineta vaga]
MVSVARWLDTFTCSKYADRFEQLGYSTLQSICQLNSSQLQNLGVSPVDICTIMDNVLLLRQSLNSLNSPRYLDLTSEPPAPSSSSSSFEQVSFDNTFTQQPPSNMIYRGSTYNIHPPNFYQPNPRMMTHSPWNHHHQPMQQFPPLHLSRNQSILSTNGSHPHPLQSLERLVHLPDSQVIDPKSIVNETLEPLSPFSETVSTTSIVSNLFANEQSLTEQNSNGLKRCSNDNDRNELNKRIRTDTNTDDSVVNNHPVVTSLLTRTVNSSTSRTPLPSITLLQQKHNN